jgi:hypothetical protein
MLNDTMTKVSDLENTNHEDPNHDDSNHQDSNHQDSDHESDNQHGHSLQSGHAEGSDSDHDAFDPSRLSLARVEAEICTLAGQIASATSRFLHLLADFDARRGWEGWNVRSCAQWLSWRCGLDLRTAREHVRVARALTELPKIRKCFDAGRISYSKVRAIARVATPISEADLLEAALHAPAAHIERLTRGLRTAQRNSDDPDDQGLKPLPDDERKHQVHWHWDDGELVFSGRLPAEDGARLLAAATRAMIELNRTDQPTRQGQDTITSPTDDLSAPQDDDPAENSSGSSSQPSTLRPPSDLAAALVAMAEMVCAADSAPVHAPAAEVVVTVDLQTLMDAFASDGPDPTSDDPDPTSDPAADTSDQTANASDPVADIPRRDERSSDRTSLGARLDDGPALAAATLRRLTDDGRMRLAVLGGDGQMLDLGRARRIPNAIQLRALWRRDHGCSVPGCGRTRFLHAHHVVFWANGGKTDLDNLVLLCGEHHRALHRGAFTIAALGRQRFRFSGSDGTTCSPAPPTHGRVDELAEAHGDITPDALEPDWDGTPLHAWAIASYLTAWRTLIRRNRTAPEQLVDR